MTTLAPFGPDDRLLVLAPHPDDETLATGMLIQAALCAGAALRIVYATDGENNPWPQRWIERRWHIGVRERTRWGERRRQEAGAALRALGVDAHAVRFLGWPDQGLTACLMRDDEPVTILAEEIRAFAPTHVALPALADRHPDHGALHVLADLALRRAACTATRLAYVVHGEGAAANPYVVPGDEADLHRKYQALLAHASQLALSRERLFGLAGRPECFDILGTVNRAPMAREAEISLRLAHQSGLRRHDLLLVLDTYGGTSRFRFALPRLAARGARVTLDAGYGRAFSARWSGDAWLLTLPPPAMPLFAIHAKLDRHWPRLVVFDDDHWCAGAGRLDDAAAARAAQAVANPA